jgi:hypothetical protein
MVRTRYPRQGHRIAPATLRELLQVAVPARYLKAAGRSKMLLCDLDETAWQRFPEAICHELAQLVISTISRAARMPMPMGSRRIPPIPRGLALADLELEVRTFNCLAAAGINHRPQDLHALSIDGILALRGFWIKSLLDLLTSLEYVIDHPAVRKTLRTNTVPVVRRFRLNHRYPRPGHRLAPQTLKEVLLMRIPAPLARGTPFRKARLCDLDESAWEHLSHEAIGSLAGLILTRASVAAHRRVIRMRLVPQPPEGMRLEDLHLENRTYKCLVREGFGKRPEELGKKTVGDLLLIRSFGTKCLLDLLSSLETRVARVGRIDKELTAEAKALGKIPEAKDIQFTDPRLGGLLRAMDTESNSLGEMVNRILRRKFDPPDPTRLHAQLRHLRDQIQTFRELPLESELAGIFASGAAPRDRQIVAAYHGWDGKGCHTLEELGKTHGLSRERIRQVCMHAIQRTRHTTVFAPVLDQAIEFLDARVPKALGALQSELDASGISPCRLSIETVQQAGKFLSRRLPFVIVNLGKGLLAADPKYSGLPRLIARAARQVVANYGAGTIGQLRADLASRGIKRVNHNLIRETLSCIANFHWLDPRRTWFLLDSLPQYGLPSIIEKVLSVAGRIEVSRLRAAIARYRRGGRQVPPARVLLEFCRQMPRTRIARASVISDPPRDWRKILAGVERIMVQALKKHGPILERNSLEDLCVRGGMSRFSFNAIVTNSPVISQFGRGVYGLVGAKADRKMIETALRAKKAAVPTQLLKASGQTSRGMVFLGYQLTKASISGGVVTVPAAFKKQLHGRYALRDAEGRHVGTLVTKLGCAWGLGPALRGAKARAGDHMLLLIDTHKREAGMRIASGNS